MNDKRKEEKYLNFPAWEGEESKQKFPACFVFFLIIRKMAAISKRTTN